MPNTCFSKTPSPLLKTRRLASGRALLQPGKLTAAIALALSAISAAQAEAQLKTITVTATRTDRPAEEVPATVTTVDRRDIERRLPADETDLLKDEPDIAVARDLRRFGSTRVNIRGIEDNRVTQMVDGVRMPDFYNSGGPTNFTMNAPLGTSIVVTDARTQGSAQAALGVLAKRGAKKVVVLPLFYSADEARYAVLRTALDGKQALPLEWTQPFGASYFAVEALADRLRALPPAQDRRLIVVGTGASDVDGGCADPRTCRASPR